MFHYWNHLNNLICGASLWQLRERVPNRIDPAIKVKIVGGCADKTQRFIIQCNECIANRFKSTRIETDREMDRELPKYCPILVLTNGLWCVTDLPLVALQVMSRGMSYICKVKRSCSCKVKRIVWKIEGDIETYRKSRKSLYKWIYFKVNETYEACLWQLPHRLDKESQTGADIVGTSHSTRLLRHWLNIVTYCMRNLNEQTRSKWSGLWCWSRINFHTEEDHIQMLLVKKSYRKCHGILKPFERRT